MAKQGKIVPVVLCGGMGSRLWPLSRSKFPKQFLGIGGEGQSFLQLAVGRVTDARFGSPVVVSNQDHRFLVAEHLLEAGVNESDIILEPMMQNTASAIAAAALFIREKDPEALMLVLASDHVIKDPASFSSAIDHAAQAARSGKLVTFGITPEYPETGYGYILRGDAVAGLTDVFSLKQFVEKPSEDVAKGYLESGNYLWNSGMFMFPVKEFLKELQAYQPQVVSACEEALAKASRDANFVHLDRDAFAQSVNISVDYAVMERTSNAAVVPVSCGWSDAGAWDALWRIGDKDAQDNVVYGKAYLKDTQGTYIQTHGGAPVAAVGVEDLVVVSTKDVVLVAPKDRAQDVKKLMEQVGEDNTQLVEHHQRVYRPWGWYETIELAARHQVKHICVKPGAKLSVQMHHHRAEHWTVVSGTAKVYLDQEERIMTENQYIFIPLGAVHSIENVGKVPLEFIEVQVGGYLGEDDIVRFSDMYGRAKE